MTIADVEHPAFDHLLHAVPDVAAAAEAYTAVGLPAHVNPPFEGFQNGAWRLDERYVEILTVTDPERFAGSPFGPAWAQLEDHGTQVLGAGGGAMVFAVDVADAAVTAARLRTDGHEVIEVPVAFDHTPVRFTEVFLADAPRWAPFFITYDPPRTELTAMAPERVDRGIHDIGAIVIETPDPTGAARWLGGVVGIDPVDDEVDLPGGAVRFRGGSADAIVEVVLDGPEPLDTTISGLRYRTADR